ncbi:hypothetical protein BDK51DRAFT_38339 [Blyttiomyces helicus]|uniref:Uncharacterized protein n=1 Tax=Blyttiomyces helicus TaxID=388810 RepID=A0A4P9VZP6_9FUNG|nr:hypothetical protein BDK51DRAFT_38339 [Blyttiomyces helicus]|eukprot:RKO83760.1 hypothetical protein BDK51DRAFT_38339 [Blyttiomyces helicus]
MHLTHPNYCDRLLLDRFGIAFGVQQGSKGPVYGISSEGFPSRPDFGHRHATDLRRLVYETSFAVPGNMHFYSRPLRSHFAHENLDLWIFRDNRAVSVRARGGGWKHAHADVILTCPVSHFRLRRLEESIQITLSSLVSYQEIFCDFTAWYASLTQNGAPIHAVGSGRNSTSWHWVPLVSFGNVEGMGEEKSVVHWRSDGKTCQGERNCRTKRQLLLAKILSPKTLKW